MQQAGFCEDEKLYVYGAMELYLDFINIFLRILSLFGKRRDQSYKNFFGLFFKKALNLSLKCAIIYKRLAIKTFIEAQRSWQRAWFGTMRSQVRSLSPRPYLETFTVSIFYVLGYLKPFSISLSLSKFLYICVNAFNFTFIIILLNAIIAFKLLQL